MEKDKKQKEQPEEQPADDKQPADEVCELKKKCEEYLNGWKRERADFLNYKKEEMERMGEIIKYANEELLLKILPILDNIYLATRQNFLSENLSGQGNIQIKNYHEGIIQIIKQLEDFLAKEGIEPIEVLGKKFDPNFHEVVEEVGPSEASLSSEASAKGEAKEAESGVIVEEVQRGYTLYGKVIRPAKVKVTK